MSQYRPLQPQWQQAPDGRWYQVQPQAQVQPYYPPQHYQPQQMQQPGYLYPQQQPYYQQPYYPPQPMYAPNIVVAVNQSVNQSVNVGRSRTQQYPFIWRLLYFLTIGWFLGLLWLFFALGCFATILGIPVGVIMLNYLPAVMTLQRH